MSAELKRAWQDAAVDLGINVHDRGDAVLVDDFGSENGMLSAVRPDRQGQQELQREAENRGMGWSVLTTTHETYDREVYIDMLNDWGWTGVGSAPPWYTGEPWTE